MDWTGLSLHPLHDQLMELRTEAVRWLAGGAMVLAFGIVYVWAFDADLTGLQNIVVAAVLGGSAGLAWFLVERTYVGAAATLILGLIGSIVVATILWSAGALVYALPLVLFVAPLLIDYRRTLLFSLGETILVGAVAALRLTPLPGSDISVALLLIVIGAGLSWVAYQPIRAMLDWTWRGYQEERRKTEEGRERQAELAQLSKSLEEACERLEQANLALAEARRAADEARRLKDEFATAISHELRTPINLIIGFSELIVDDADTGIPAVFRDDVETIYRNACHLSTLVDDVLDLGRLDAHRLALVKEWTSLPRIVQEAISAVKGLCENAGIPIMTELPDDLPSLYLDPTRIRQVLINLLTNAARYVEAGFIRVAARSDGRDVVVSVADTGVGIPAEDLPHVFERFHQTGQPHRRGGFGLGLTVSKQLVEMHAGSMWVTSELDRGTTFCFSLPVATNVVAHASNPRLQLLEAQHSAGPNERVVVVVGEDADAARVFQRYLDGYQVRVATTPTDVRQISRKKAISAVVTTNETSDELRRAVRAHLRDVPSVHCSLRTTTRASRQLGVSAFLTKPVTIDQLRRTLRELKARPHRALVVDDDPEMVSLLSRMLHQLFPRCRLLSATSGARGLDLARGADVGDPLDLILLDLLMPELDGHSFLAAWHADHVHGEIPIVVISAATEEEHGLVVGESVEVRRDTGLSVAELMRVVSGSLDRLRPA
ncbi:MAG: ATP-binding protein [Chloroflexota bacterium]